jgi:hypothetical protein
MTETIILADIKISVIYPKIKDADPMLPSTTDAIM